MTDEMLALARENQRKAGVENVEFLKGEIEQHPAARQQRGRHHLQLRDQPVRRQGPRAGRGVPRAEAGRPLRRVRRRGARRDPGGDPAQRGIVGRLPRRRPGRIRLRRAPRGAPASRTCPSSRRACTRWRTRGSSCRGMASTWTPSRRWWTAGSSAASSARGSRPAPPHATRPRTGRGAAGAFPDAGGIRAASYSGWTTEICGSIDDLGFDGVGDEAVLLGSLQRAPRSAPRRRSAARRRQPPDDRAEVAGA